MRRARTRSTGGRGTRPGDWGDRAAACDWGGKATEQPGRGAGRSVGYEIVSDKTIDTTSSGGVNGFFSVSCPQGKKAVGGGGSAVDGGGGGSDNEE